MITTLLVVLIALWMLGMFTSYTMGGLIHILLAAAVIVFIVRVLRRRPLAA
jgi:Family of unknown function (DUF5670)